MEALKTKVRKILDTTMIEVKECGEQVIRRDVLVKEYGLNER